jgi:ABC-2 type transport system ATP-binding protein
MRSLVRQLREDHTVIVSSHILSEISETCDRLLVIRDGMIVASGTEEELSQQLLEGIQIELSLRVDEAQVSKVVQLLGSVPGVTKARTITQRELGDRVKSFAVQAQKDVREDVGTRLYEAGFRLLALNRMESELEDVFLKLAEGKSNGAGRASEGTR